MIGNRGWINLIKKRSIRRMCIPLLSLLFCIFGLFGWDYLEASKASAATTSYYTMPFDYSGSYGAYGMNQPTSVSDTNVTSYSFGTYTVRTISLKIYGTGYSGSATATKGQYFNFNSLNIIADVATSTSGTTSLITACKLTSNTTGALVVNNTALANKTLSTALYSGTLADGSYTLSVSWSAKDYFSSYPNQTQKNVSITLTTSFKIDTTAPVLSGTSSSTAGKYTNAAFTVSASDGGSGVNTIYMKAPGASSFTSVGMSKTISTGSTNGLYTFYAVDNQSNKSEYGYVFYDNTAAVGTLKNGSGGVISETAINYDFSYSASDNSSGISYLQYLTPNSTVWTTYTSGTLIKASATNGKYQFRAVDKCGNISNVTSVILDTVKGTGTLYAANLSVSNGAIVKAEYIKFVASDGNSGVGTIYMTNPSGKKTTYTNGSQIAVDGLTSFYFVDLAGNVSDTYKITRDTGAPTLTCVEASWGSTINKGFTIKAIDTYSDVSIYYKIPGSSAYTKASSSVNIPITSPDGIYYVYAEDSLGNRSDIKSIDLKVALPSYIVETTSVDNHVRISWNITNYKATLNGSTYIKNTWITVEGDYQFILKDTTTNRSAEYSFSITHFYEIKKVTPPSCVLQGFTTYGCISCTSTYDDDYTSPLGHSNYVKQVVEPTCIANGYSIYNCKVCEENEFISDMVSPLGHSNYVREVVAPTCIANGYSIYNCKVCADNEYVANVVDALGHDYVIEVVAPTCVLQGYSIYDCSRCTSRYTADFVVAHGHYYEEEIIDPTCVEKGYTLHTCSVCGDNYATDYVLALGHDYTEITIMATCTEPGGINHICVVCEYNYITEKQDALGHSYTSAVTKTSSCSTQGLRTHTCENCRQQYTTVIPCLEHKYVITDTETNGSVTRHYDCSECGYSYSEDKGNQYEVVTSYIEYLYEEYSPYMIWVFLSTAGVWSIAMGIAVIIAYRNEDKIKANQMIKNYVIGLVVIFGILVAMPYLVNGIAYLITH